MPSEDPARPVDDDPITFAVLAVMLAVSVAVLSRIYVPYPLSSIPYSLATLGVYLGGLVLGPVWAVLSLGAYLLAFGLDVPFFGPPIGSGTDFLAGPLGGYLLSYPLAAGVVGGLVHRGLYPRPLTDVSVLYQAGVLVVGIFLVYPVGAVWLGLSTPVSLGGAVVGGGLPYLPGEAAKAGTALVLATGGYYLLGHLTGD